MSLSRKPESGRPKWNRLALTSGTAILFIAIFLVGLWYINPRLVLWCGSGCLVYILPALGVVAIAILIFNRSR